MRRMSHWETIQQTPSALPSDAANYAQGSVRSSESTSGEHLPMSILWRRRAQRQWSQGSLPRTAPELPRNPGQMFNLRRLSSTVQKLYSPKELSAGPFERLSWIERSSRTGTGSYQTN
uniref:(northern house mosquito) hypothetical protein n=1 Tax=Culex pipiens TaxID=7175 RepID=A0A8D8JWU0_CULPI